MPNLICQRENVASFISAAIRIVGVNDHRQICPSKIVEMFDLRYIPANQPQGSGVLVVSRRQHTGIIWIAACAPATGNTAAVVPYALAAAEHRASCIAAVGRSVQA